jgi:hypothetical protein
MQSNRALSFYTDEVHLLGDELSLDTQLVRIFPELNELAEPTARPTVAMSPTAPFLASTRDLLRRPGCLIVLPPRARRAAKRRPIRSRRVAGRSRHTAPFACRQQFGTAGAVFGFHLAAVDLRQNSDTIDELIEMGIRGSDIAVAPRKHALLCCSTSSRHRVPPGVAVSLLFRGNEFRAANPPYRREDAGGLRQGGGPRRRAVLDRPAISDLKSPLPSCRC